MAFDILIVERRHRGRHRFAPIPGRRRHIQRPDRGHRLPWSRRGGAAHRRHSGHVVAPGFIDMHTHSDVTLFDDPGGDSKAHQGVTTEVTGNCSYSPFPAGRGGPKALQDELGKSAHRRRGLGMEHSGRLGRRRSSRTGSASTSRPQVGNSALQIASGAIEDRPATPDELREMKRLAAEAVEMGAFSVSTGLSVTPSAYASTDEIVAICESIRRYEGAFYVTHARVGNGLHMSAIRGGHRD